MQFNQVIGQEEIKRKLIQTVKNQRISHTQMFLGQEGSGALPLALAYAQYINCTQPQENDSCGTCASCVKFSKLVHPDLHFTFPTITDGKRKLSNDFLEEWRKAFAENPYMGETGWLFKLDEDGKKQGNITAEECRDVIRKVGLKAYEAKYKTVIIWLPEYLRQEGNILLKLLEEPPPQTLILLVAHDSEKVIATILSRAQIMRVPRLKDEEVSNVLQQQYEVPAKDADTYARVSEGNLSLALSLVNAGHAGFFDLFVRWMRLCYNSRKQIGEVSAWVDECTKQGREFLKSYLNYSLQMVRASLIYRYGNRESLRLSEEERDFIEKFHVALNNENIPVISKAMNETITHIERNADLKITFLNLSLYIGRQLSRQ